MPAAPEGNSADPAYRRDSRRFAPSSTRSSPTLPHEGEQSPPHPWLSLAGCARGARSVVDWPKVALADRGASEHGHRGQAALPVRRLEALQHRLHRLRIEAACGDFLRREAVQQPVQNLIRLIVRDAEVPLVRLSVNEIG